MGTWIKITVAPSSGIDIPAAAVNVWCYGPIADEVANLSTIHCVCLRNFNFKVGPYGSKIFSAVW